MTRALEKNILDKLLIGRDEWCQLPELNIPAIKAKIDTGAKTSAIHAFNIQSFHLEGQRYVRFDIHPIQGDNQTEIACQAPVIDIRQVISSNGHRETRYVIVTKIHVGDKSWDIEATLSNRDPLRYRMLLGREALNGRVLVHPGISCNQGRISKRQVLKLYASI